VLQENQKAGIILEQQVNLLSDIVFYHVHTYAEIARKQPHKV
jgi:hypothetical protein